MNKNNPQFFTLDRLTRIKFELENANPAISNKVNEGALYLLKRMNVSLDFVKSNEDIPCSEAELFLAKKLLCKAIDVIKNEGEQNYLINALTTSDISQIKHDLLNRGESESLKKFNDLLEETYLTEETVRVLFIPAFLITPESSILGKAILR